MKILTKNKFYVNLFRLSKSKNKMSENVLDLVKITEYKCNNNFGINFRIKLHL